MGSLAGAHNLNQTGAHNNPIKVPTRSPCPHGTQITQKKPMWGPYGHVGWETLAWTYIWIYSKEATITVDLAEVPDGKAEDIIRVLTEQVGIDQILAVRSKNRIKSTIYRRNM